MRNTAFVLVLAACACTSKPTTAPKQPGAGANPAVAQASAERLQADSPGTTSAGHSFIAPAGWSMSMQGSVTVLSPPEPDAWIALVDVRAKSPDQAVKTAWKMYRPEARWPLKVVTARPDREGWTDIQVFEYQTSPNEKRDVQASARRAGNDWLVTFYDMPSAVGEKRMAQVALIFERLQPRGFERESFAGRKANKLDKAQIAELGQFVERAQKQLGVPGVSIGLVQDGEVVFAGGYGVRALGSERKVDADTLYMIASNSKSLTTLMLAKLVEAQKLTWETPVTQALPSFKLGDAETTRQVLIKHLVCACTGLPRQDAEWLFEFKGVTPERAMATLATMQPTSKFGEMFQYSNPLAAGGGFVGGHVEYPALELGAAYDKAMQRLVFDPLGMNSTTFDFARAQKRNFATAHSHDVDGKLALAAMDVNYAIVPVRPAGGAWSNVRDLLKYVQMELAEGTLPNGKRYIAKEPLLARRAPQVTIGKEGSYGMALFVDTKYDVTVVHHGGDLIGYHSDMLWLPEHNVGAVILTNGDPGWLIRTIFRRKLLEVLFDGKPEADADIAAAGQRYFAELAAERKLLSIPADAALANQLAARYRNDALGELAVSRQGDRVRVDVGEWQSELASRKNPDGSASFVTIRPGMAGVEFVVGKGQPRTLIVRDAQHEYVFTEIPDAR